ncbi:MAG: DnaJ family domain-containing protein [Pseudomonadota bacterium]
MFFLTELAERKITEAVERGDPSTVATRGAPLDFDRDRHVPSDVRALYRVLKHAGVVPPDVARHRERAALQRVDIDRLSPAQRQRRRARLALLSVALERTKTR